MRTPSFVSLLGRSLVALLVLVPSFGAALEVAVDSPCSTVCLDSPTGNPSDSSASNTNPPNIACEDWEVTGHNSTALGNKWISCMQCLETSAYAVPTTDGDVDVNSVLFNIKSTILWCVLGRWDTKYNQSPTRASNACFLSSCKPIAAALNDQIKPVKASTRYHYCDAADGAFSAGIATCRECMANRTGMDMLNNFLGGLVDACDQKPDAGTAIKFTTPLYQIRTPNDTSSTPSSTATPAAPSETGKQQPGDDSKLSVGAIVGISVGVAMPIAIAIAIGIAMYCLHRRRVRRQTWGPRDSIHYSIPMSPFGTRVERMDQWAYTPPAEMNTAERLQELQGQSPASEMDSKMIHSQTAPQPFSPITGTAHELP